MINQIDSFLNVISDPRNISPEDFAEYYPKSGELGNTKNLDKNTIENKFCQLQKFNITESWDGYVPLMPKIYALLVMFEKQSNNDKEIFLNYFALTSKGLSLKTQSFINEKKLTKPEYYELHSIYLVFVSHLITSMGNELTELKEGAIKELGLADKKELKPIPRNALHIFENEKGYNLFLEMHEIYKDKVSIHLSNYSFLYHALLKKNLIAHSNKNFVNYIGSEFDVHITKIDIRQKEKNDDNRQLLFDNLLDSLQNN